MKKIILMVIFIVAIALLSSCEKEAPQKEQETESIAESETQKSPSTEAKTEGTETTEDTEEGTESETEGWIYPDDARGYMNYPWKNQWFGSIDTRFSGLVSDEAFLKYQGQFDYMGGTRDTDSDYNIYDFVKYFNIPKEDFIKANSDLFDYSEEEIEMIYAEDKTRKEVYEYFLAPHAIMVDTKIFGAGWLGTHNADDCRANGITAEMLEEKLPAIKEFMTPKSGIDSYYKIVVNKIEKNIKELRAAG